MQPYGRDERERMAKHMGGELKLLGQRVAKLLAASVALGATYIITNAMEGWVEHTTKKYMPDVLPMLEKVRVISARSAYGELFPCNVEQWKFHAFLETKKSASPEILTNIIAVSDSERDAMAAHNLAA